MKKNIYLKLFGIQALPGLKLFKSLLPCLLFSYTVNAQQPTAAAEKKVDYLEKIYFSGKNKAELNALILIALQELESKSPTPALAKQVTFLLAIKENAKEAANACEILEMLSVGIYNIDAAEAVLQGVIPASGKKATAKTSNALESLNKLNNGAINISSSATNLGWSSYLIGSSNFGSGVFKVAGAAANISKALGSVGEVAKGLDQVKDMLGPILKKKDKACTDIPQKNIEIGEHLIPGAGKDPNLTISSIENPLTPSATQITIINIPRVSSGLLRALTDSLRIKPGVQSAEKTYNETMSTITIVHSGSTDAVADWLEDKFGTKFKLMDYANDNGRGKINLAPKS